MSELLVGNEWVVSGQQVGMGLVRCGYLVGIRVCSVIIS